jgi:predicted MPP superfamily phosphohydrolase
MIARKSELMRPGRALRRHRRHLTGATLGTLGFCTRWAVDAGGIGPEWIEVVEIDLRLRRLPERLRGTRIAHISDLHCSSTVSGEYLRRCVDRINRLSVDLVVLTGDYITYDLRGRYRQKVAEILSGIRSRLGTYACWGNHDYGVRSQSVRRRAELLRRMRRAMKAADVTVLRNESGVVDVDGYPLWVIGLGDLWVDDFRPRRAFADVPADETTITLTHNPRGAELLGAFPASVVMSGHTHGRRLSPPLRPTWTTKRRRYYAGMYDLAGTQLYVNRGLGRHGRARLNTPPEITVLTLR